MSSILNALKRLEAERQTPGGSPPAWIARDGDRPKEPARLRFFPNSGSGGWLAVVLGLLVLAAAGWFVWQGFSPKGTDFRPAAVSPDPATPPPPAAPQPSRQPPQQSADTRSSSVAAPLRKTAPSPIPPTKSASAPVMPWAETAARPAPASPALPLPDSSLPPLPVEVGLTLQAVTWSAQAGKRLAVVSGQILRAGDDIDGYRIQEITPDAAILCRSGQCYRLAFHP